MIFEILAGAVMSAFVVFAYLDFSVSSKFLFYGLDEENKLFRNKFGEFVLWKGILWTGIAFIVAACLWIFVHPVGALIISVALIKIAALYFGNVKAMKARRTEQISKLRQLRTLIENGEPTMYFWASLKWRNRSGRFCYPLFMWIYLDNVGNGVPPDSIFKAIQSRVEHLAVQPENTWFPK